TGASRPPVVLRARRGDRDALVRDLVAAGSAAHAGEQPEEVVVEDGDAAALAPVREGRAVVQDGTAQRIAPLADVRPGDRVRDRLRESDVAALALLQRDLVARALPLVRRGGRLVFATCSVEPEEGADNAAAMAAASGARLEPAFAVLPSPAHDGGYAAVLHVG